MDQNNDILVQYMVEFDVPQPFTEELMSMVPAQRNSIEQLFTSGKLLSYTVAADKSKVWAVMIAESESELLSYIDELPMTCLLYTSPSPRDRTRSRMPSSA